MDKVEERIINPYVGHREDIERDLKMIETRCPLCTKIPGED